MQFPAFVLRPKISTSLPYYKLFFLLILSSSISALWVTEMVNNGYMKILLVSIIEIMLLIILRLPFSESILLCFMTISTSIAARLRFGEELFHQGGAEASIAPIDFPLVALLISWFFITKLRSNSEGKKQTLIEYAYVLLLLAHVPSLFVATEPYLSLLEILRLLKMGLIIWTIKKFIISERQIDLILGTLLAITLIQSIIVLIQVGFHTSLGLGFLGESDVLWIDQRGNFSFGRGGGTLGHANALANFLELSLPVALAIWFGTTSNRLKTLSFAVLLFGVPAQFLTYSRAGWLGLLVGLLFVLVFVLPKLSGRNATQLALVVILVICGVAVLLISFGDLIYQRLEVGTTESWTLRLRTADLAWVMIENNILFGIGSNNYMASAAIFAGGSFFSNFMIHNMLLLIAAETGIVGTLSFFILIIAIFVQSLRVWLHQTQSVRYYSLGVLGGIVGLLVHSMFDWLFKYDPVFTMFWFQCGILVAMTSILTKNSKKKGSESALVFSKVKHYKPAVQQLRPSGS